MKRQWSPASAMAYLMSQKAEVSQDKRFLMKTGGWNGLKACSAADYLQNYCHIKIIY